MNRQTLLSIYERLEAIIAKLPGPLQNAVIGELKPIKEIFLSQRLARIVLVGKAKADASALLSGLLGGDLQMIEARQTGGWVTYELRGRGGFRILDARRLNETSLTWSGLSRLSCSRRRSAPVVSVRWPGWRSRSARCLTAAGS